MDLLTFTEHPNVTLATNTFVGVPVILQYESTPLIQVVRLEKAGFTTKISIYHSDGTYLAKVVGSQIYRTADGKKAGVSLEHPDLMTVCKLNDQVLFEIRRTEAAGLRTEAELYAPDGYFVKCTASSAPQLFDASGAELKVGGVSMTGCKFSGCKIGVWVKGGEIAIGCN